jgi:hypothetical protein
MEELDIKGQIRFHGIQEGKKYDRWRSCSEKNNFLRREFPVAV